ncbi:ubiquinone anaerobic biosynthesis protein UbiV [Sedimenticola selenatireducens]|uniref:Ubiquinone biosynthesis protein UbiV n=1 Tax=Sedimenticola selenatireducens TaxID=191960 RepID=A0A558DK51_9GAMM|nr:U32 family peptidase [Sedimenticola selenatireducens]TVO76281.1 U32 family peptidase [Sedimenticola selenatireducens]TVT61391.1 MAG: U32 family peptidase [Sedimenticola selenatireducens]
MNAKPKLSLGPVLYYWAKDQLLDFYEEMASSPVDIIYLGETICSKRSLMRTDDWFSLAERLSAAGKEVVFSTLALLEAESELKRLRRLCDNGKHLVEANDMGAVQMMRGKPFVAGHSVNIYNERTLNLLARQGLKRWVFPVELSKQTLKVMQELRPEGVETELFAYGRLPLAYSARCFTARAYNLPKDDCQYRCLDFPDGLTLSAQDDTRFLALNGIQTQSAHTFNLISEIDQIRELDVDVLRISPQAHHTGKIIALFDQCLRGDLSLESGGEKLDRLIPVGSCNGYWYGDAGMENKAQAAAQALL